MAQQILSISRLFEISLPKTLTFKTVNSDTCMVDTCMVENERAKISVWENFSRRRWTWILPCSIFVQVLGCIFYHLVILFAPSWFFDCKQKVGYLLVLLLVLWTGESFFYLSLFSKRKVRNLTAQAKLGYLVNLVKKRKCSWIDWYERFLLISLI